MKNKSQLFQQLRESIEAAADHPQNVYNDYIRHGAEYTGNQISVEEALSIFHAFLVHNKLLR